MLVLDVWFSESNHTIGETQKLKDMIYPPSNNVYVGYLFSGFTDTAVRPIVTGVKKNPYYIIEIIIYYYIIEIIFLLNSLCRK